MACRCCETSFPYGDSAVVRKHGPCFLVLPVDRCRRGTLLYLVQRGQTDRRPADSCRRRSDVCWSRGDLYFIDVIVMSCQMSFSPSVRRSGMCLTPMHCGLLSSRMCSACFLVPRGMSFWQRYFDSRHLTEGWMLGSVSVFMWPNWTSLGWFIQSILQ